MTSPLMKNSPFRAPVGAAAGDRPGPAVYTAGSERLVVSFSTPDAVSIVYTNPQATISTRAPLPVGNLRPANNARPSVISRLELSPFMRTAVQSELMTMTRSADPLGARFFDAQRMIFVDSFTCDPMEEDAIIKRLA